MDKGYDTILDSEKILPPWQWKAEDDKPIILKAIKVSDTQENFAIKAIGVDEFTVIGKIKPHFMGNGEMAGLSVIGKNYYSLMIEKEGEKLYAKQTDVEYCNNEISCERQLGCFAIRNVDKEKVYLKIEFNKGQLKFYYSFDGENYGKIGYTNIYIGDNENIKVAIFASNRNDTNTEGYAEFEYIKVK